MKYRKVSSGIPLKDPGRLWREDSSDNASGRGYPALGPAHSSAPATKKALDIFEPTRATRSAPKEDRPAAQCVRHCPDRSSSRLLEALEFHSSLALLA
ncbi:hypothetical protein KM043_005238 [Ampulex compressa]|nr:hypothetical protein KM043_005238 [Ampulex compressa]